MTTLHPTIANAINPFVTLAQPKKHIAEPSYFNDDDVYVYQADTLQIVQHLSHHFHAVREAGYAGIKVMAGQAWTKGLTGKHLGLWSAA